AAPVDQFGDVFLVVDGWRTVRDEYELLESQITALAGQGLPVGATAACESAGRGQAVAARDRPSAAGSRIGSMA
ncbi:hypothetical protein, partial [Nocardia carnea]|uniref:hypothetical protein n=1 Tax=Nocardia carnea TaxID=37328 RepID=UPI002454FB86